MNYICILHLHFAKPESQIVCKSQRPGQTEKQRISLFDKSRVKDVARLTGVTSLPLLNSQIGVEGECLIAKYHRGDFRKEYKEANLNSKFLNMVVRSGGS
ncbi:hypothetical protein O6P43_019894 [Quillaja saponaria]|uniref:Uncharacterized protein n=1 Tax=Quillaja saponaria TaxID=32244 RepID=A0AAD7LL42_QUISA|nr:hypothetical protein O6P43_019894 [Quillaja saponaria]